jgi:hypothetical protein
MPVKLTPMTKLAPKTIPVDVAQDVDKPVAKPVLAQAIVDISRAAQKLAAGGLNRKAVVVLLSHASKVPQGTVKLVLDGLEKLAETYTK